MLCCQPCLCPEDRHPGEPSNNVRAGSGVGGEDAVAITFVGDFAGQWNVSLPSFLPLSLSLSAHPRDENALIELSWRCQDIHDIGYNRKSGCTSCATNEEAVWGSYPICKAGPGYEPGAARNYGGNGR